MLVLSVLGKRLVASGLSSAFGRDTPPQRRSPPLTRSPKILSQVEIKAGVISTNLSSDKVARRLRPGGAARSASGSTSRSGPRHGGRHAAANTPGFLLRLAADLSVFGRPHERFRDGLIVAGSPTSFAVFGTADRPTGKAPFRPAFCSGDVAKDSHRCGFRRRNHIGQFRVPGHHQQF